jgi:hypothetical protein
MLVAHISDATRRTVIERLAAFLVVLNLIVPASAMARMAVPGAVGVPICTADGMTHVPSPDGMPSEDGHGHHCALCTLAAGGSLLAPPGSLRLPGPDMEGSHTRLAPRSEPARATHPQGSFSARAPPTPA